MSRSAAVVAALLPPLLVAVLGLMHPYLREVDGSMWWQAANAVGLAAVPALALAPWLVVRGRGRLVDGIAVVLGSGFVAFYIVVDALSVLGGPSTSAWLHTVGPGPSATTLFADSEQSTLPGVYAYLAATVFVAGVVLSRTSGRVRLLALVGGLVAVGGAASFAAGAVFYLAGTATMGALALGWTLLALAGTAAPAPAAEESVAHPVSA